MANEFKLVQGGTLAKVLVSVGDKIEEEQPVLELETDKAVVEVPSEVSGVVKEILVQAGQKLNEGTVASRLKPKHRVLKRHLLRLQVRPLPRSQPTAVHLHLRLRLAERK
jgi:pyruvate dehydrogenase E2 component (dihydrolipoamide acetyltransferase)